MRRRENMCRISSCTIVLSGVLYKHQCEQCNSVFIGKTKPSLVKCLEEHKSVSALTVKLMKTFQVWPPIKNSKECKSNLSHDNF